MCNAGHTDVVHAVEGEHNGAGDSSVLYIPAVPLTERKCVPRDVSIMDDSDH